MRILVLTGDHNVSKNEAISNHRPGVTLTVHPDVMVRDGDTEVIYKSIRTRQDADNLRGQRFDLIIEDGSFNPHRSHAKGSVLEYVKIIVLR